MSSSGPESWTDLFLKSLGAHEASRSKPGARVDGAPTIPRYEIRERVGEGATAVVYRAWDRELKRTIALKVLRGRAAMSDVLRERFHREAQATAGLDHAHVIRVHDAGEHRGELYLVLEFVSGRSLAHLLSERRFSERESASLLEKVARGIAAAHANGVVHRDLKPGNILVTEPGEPKVGDFGLAHVVDSDTTRLTQTGSSLGTPLYMAPEQVEGRWREISPRTDVYALGAVLYEMLSGRPPHLGATPAEIYRRILEVEVEPLRNLRPEVSRDLEKIALKALEKDPRARYADAREFADELNRFQQGEPVLARTQPTWMRAWRRASRHRSVWIPTVAAILVAAVAGGTLAAQGRARTRRVEETLAAASSLEKEGSVQKARELFLQVVGQDAQNASARQGVERTDRTLKRAQSLLESARPALERASSGLYSAEVSYASLVDQVKQAQGPIEEAVRLVSDFPLAHHRLGELWEILGYYDRAESSWRRARQADPAFAPAHFRLGRILVWRAYQASLSYVGDDVEDRESGARRLAEEASREIEAARKDSAGFDREIQSDIAAAMTAFLLKQKEKVTESCAAAIARHAGQRGVEEFWWMMGMVAKVRAEKMRCFNQAILLRPKFPLALYSRAAQQTAVPQSVEEAIRDYDRVIELCPTFAEAYVNRGSQKFRIKDARGAIEDFEVLIRMGERLDSAYNGRGRARAELLGDLEGGLADLAEAIRANPNNYFPYLSRSQIYLKQGEFDHAIADSTRSFELNGTPWAIYTRFRARLLKGDEPGALEDGRAFLKAAARDNPAWGEVQKAVDDLARKLPK